MFKRVVTLVGLAALAAAPLRAAAPRAPAAGRRRRHGPVLRPGRAAARVSSAGRFGPRRVSVRAVLRRPGRRVGHRPRDLPLLHPAEAEPAVPGQLDALRRGGREDDPRRLPPPLEHQLPRQPLDRRHRLHLLERRRRQAGLLQHGGAPARQDRRLRRLEADRDVEGRRAAEGRHGGDPPRHLHRSRAGAEGVGDRPRHAQGEGLSGRRGHAGDRDDAGRAEARAPHVPHVGRAEGQDQAHRVHRQQGDEQQHAETAG